MKSYAILKFEKDLRLVRFSGLHFGLESFLEGEYIMKLSNMRKNGMLDSYHPLVIRQPLLQQQLIRFVPWRYWFYILVLHHLVLIY